MAFQSQRILITGADGFIGSHLAERLCREGARVRAMVYYNAFGYWGWLDEVPEDVRRNIEVIMGDVRDPESTARACRDMDLVLHLAALIGIPYSYEAPRSYLDTNALGTLNILQAALGAGVGRVVVTSTSEVYGSALTVPIAEDHPRQAQSPYSASKIAADALAMSFHLSFGLPVTIARPFNTYGPRQSARAIIPTIITQLLDGRPSVELGALHPTRDLVFVHDTVEGLLRLATAPEAVGREVNIATGKEVSVGDLARRLVERLRPGTPVVTDPRRMRPEHSEVDRLLGDPGLLLRLTGWQPSISLEEGLDQTLSWFTGHTDPKRYKSDAYTV
ncbi:MAG TPA: SDR family NAD(P)-dependent oxidoreductase [Bacteroidales bacterium]|nr:SDR family NAD(P)-dependent oxidoreductase [Bacteroidales bacterium]